MQYAGHVLEPAGQLGSGAAGHELAVPSQPRWGGAVTDGAKLLIMPKARKENEERPLVKAICSSQHDTLSPSVAPFKQL